MNVKIKRTIFKTSLITFGVCLSLLYLIVVIASMFFPIIVADISFNLGNTQIATIYYYNDYQKSNNIRNLYKAFSLSNQNKNDKLIVKYFEKLCLDERYEDFVLLLNSVNNNSELIPLAKSKTINEDNYFKNVYVKALINLNRTDYAFEKSIEYFKENDILNISQLDDLIVYSFGKFLNVEQTANFLEGFLYEDEKFTSSNKTLLYEIYSLQLRLVSVYESNKTNLKMEDKARFIHLCEQIIEIINNLKTIKDNLETTVISQSQMTDMLVKKAEILSFLNGII